MAGKINIDITSDEHIFIDGATGERITPQEFAQRNKRFGLGNIAATLESLEGVGEAEETKEQENI